MKKMAALLFIMTILALPAQTSAHVFITDTTGEHGAVLHINPDDDPIAGQKSSFFFDAQGSAISENSSVKLTVTNDMGGSETVTAQLSGSLATSEYTFPFQGQYELSFKVAANGQNLEFKHTQRVSRGERLSALDEPSHEWAELLLLTSGIGLVLLIIVAINRRKSIKLQSKW